MTVAAPAAASPVADTDVSATATVEADTTGTEGDASLGRAATLITVATLVASMGNYGVNLVAARWLSPAAFGDASLVVTLMLAATAATVAFQLVTAQQISIADDDARRAHRRSALRRSFRLGLVGAAILAAAAPWLRDASSSASALPLVLLAVSLPFALAQSVERGVLQGRLAFRQLAATLLVEAAARSVVTVTLLAAGAGAAGVAIGVLVSFVASWAWGRTAALRCERGTVVGSSARPAAPTTASSAVARATSTLLVGQVLVNNGDVVLAKMLFDADAAGVYAVVALVGRAVFFLSWSVATAAFPHAAREGADDTVRRDAMRMVALMCAVLTAGVAAVAPFASSIVFGAGYESAGPLFLPYAAATSLFALANLSATLDAARGRMVGAVLVVLGAIGQTGLLLLGATSPTRMVWLQVVAMAGLLCAVSLGHRLSARRR